MAAIALRDTLHVSMGNFRKLRSEPCGGASEIVADIGALVVLILKIQPLPAAPPGTSHREALVIADSPNPPTKAEVNAATPRAN